MAYAIENIITETGINSDVITYTVGPAKVQVYTHGAINTLHYSNVDVTAQRKLEQQLVDFTKMYMQRGANPLMGPQAGRYGSNASYDKLPRIAQPGSEDIHGIFAGIMWNILDIDESDNSIILQLPAERWKNVLIEYYLKAALNRNSLSEERLSLNRLLDATERRFSRNKESVSIIKELKSLILNPEIDKSIDRLVDLIYQLVNLSYPGEATLTRTLKIEIIDKATTRFIDTVDIKNISKTNPYYDACGFHTYFNTFLAEIYDFWEDGRVPEVFDDNLKDVQVRILDQRERLGRVVAIIPTYELAARNTNQIIYRDETLSSTHPEVAIENWRQPGNGFYYPEKARVITPGETSRIGIEVIVTKGENFPRIVHEYIAGVNSTISTTEQ